MVQLNARRLGLVGASALALLCLLGAAEGQEESAQQLAARERERALSLESDIANGLKIYRTCAECHQPEGWGLPDGSYPQLAGQHKQVIIKQLADIRAGVRVNPEMMRWVEPKRIADARGVADVAGYIDTLELSVNGGKGPGQDLERGGELYAASCARCHGPEGEGNGPEFVPRIQSQHFAYLLRQFQAIRDGRRGNADPDMQSHVQGVTDADARVILDYVSRLEPPEMFQAPPGWRNPDFN
jgi:cytochrome c553